MDHPLLSLLVAAAEGRFPPVDGGVTVVNAPDMIGGVEAIVAFTGHAVVSTTLPASAVLGHGRFDGFGGAHHPDAIRWFAGADGWIGSLDLVLVSRGTGRPVGMAERTDLDHHYRVIHARELRRDVRVFGDDRGLVTLGRGMVGRWEMSVEVDPAARSRGAGRSLIADALNLVPAGHLLFAEVAPGNVASIRAFLSVGFLPICSEVIARPDRGSS
jgi:GNAT superfamily N-acetyltransferase